MPDDDASMLFALAATRDFGARVAERLSLPLADLEERSFEDGEHKSRPLVNVRDRDVFVVQSLYSDAEQSVNDKLVRLLFFIGTLHDASAGRITAVVPYLAYARKDRKTQTRDPVTSRYMAQLVEAVGTDRIVTLDVHNLAAYQNAFRIHADHLEALPLFVAHFAAVLANEERITVISPDIGGAKRADRFRAALQSRLDREIAFGFMEKARARGRMTAGRLYGDVAGRAVVILDDLISTGGTLRLAGAAAKEQGARVVYAAASHGVFVEGADQALAGDELDGVVVTDTIPPFRLRTEAARGKLTVLTATDLFAEAIRRIHTGGSLVDLLAT